MAGSQGRMKVRHKLQPDEIFEELGEMMTRIELCLYEGDEDDPEEIDYDSVVSDFKFYRNNLEDLRPDPEVVEDDMVVNAAIYAHYGFNFAKVCRFRDRAKRAWQEQRGRVYRKISQDVHSDPDLNPKCKTQYYIESLVDATTSVRALATIYDNAEEAVAIIKHGLKAMEMKHDNCIEIDRSRRKEAGLIGSTHVRSKVDDDDRKNETEEDENPLSKYTGRRKREKLVEED